MDPSIKAFPYLLQSFDLGIIYFWILLSGKDSYKTGQMICSSVSLLVIKCLWTTMQDSISQQTWCCALVPPPCKPTGVPPLRTPWPAANSCTHAVCIQTSKKYAHLKCAYPKWININGSGHWGTAWRQKQKTLPLSCHKKMQIEHGCRAM